MMNERATRVIVATGCAVSTWYVLYFAVSLALLPFGIHLSGRIATVLAVVSAYGSPVAVASILTAVVFLFLKSSVFPRKALRVLLLVVGLLVNAWIIFLWIALSGMQGLGG